jgi:hypothetical protein
VNMLVLSMLMVALVEARIVANIKSEIRKCGLEENNNTRLVSFAIREKLTSVRRLWTFKHNAQILFRTLRRCGIRSSNLSAESR